MNASLPLAFSFDPLLLGMIVWLTLTGLFYRLPFGRLNVTREDRRQIEWKVGTRFQPPGRLLVLQFVVPFGVLTVSLGLLFLLNITSPILGYLPFALLVLSSIPGSHAHHRWMTQTVIPTVLKEMNRCTRCGYPRSQTDRCSECGQLVEPDED